MRMRMAIAENAVPPLILTFNNNATFYKGDYPGYSNFEVVCVGGSGGLGNWGDYAFWGGRVYYSGGGGGGGGTHRVSGLLTSLASSISVVVGAAGGTAVAGGASSFGGTLCRASGGRPGDDAYDNSEGAPPSGGRGGIGNTITAGGGGLPGADGTWNGTIGAGGGGGSGGALYYGFPGQQPGDETGLPTGPSGRGAWNVSDSAFHALGAPGQDWDYLEQPDPPAGGGSRPTPLTGTTTPYGSQSPNGKGVVVVKLT